MADTEVSDNPAGHRYEITVGGEAAGHLEYHDRGTRRTFVHTVVDPAFEGQGVGSRLVRGALDDARRNRLEVVPVCSFVRSYLDRHPEYADVVASG